LAKAEYEARDNHGFLAKFLMKVGLDEHLWVTYVIKEGKPSDWIYFVLGESKEHFCKERFTVSFADENDVCVEPQNPGPLKICDDHGPTGLAHGSEKEIQDFLRGHIERAYQIGGPTFSLHFDTAYAQYDLPALHPITSVVRWSNKEDVSVNPYHLDMGHAYGFSVSESLYYRVQLYLTKPQ
jgi:hypothetical protein